MRLGFGVLFFKSPQFQSNCSQFLQESPWTEIPLRHRSMAPNHSWMKSVLLCLVVCSNPHDLQLFPKLGNNTNHILYDQAISCTHKYSLKNSLGTASARFWLHCDTGTFLCSRGGFFIMRHWTKVRSSSSDQKKSVPESVACSPQPFVTATVHWAAALLCSCLLRKAENSALWEINNKCAVCIGGEGI